MSGHIGESYSVPGTSGSYQLAGNVALLTRNIKIIGQEYPEMNTQSYGARVLVGTFFSGGIDFRGLNFIKFSCWPSFLKYNQDKL